MSATLRRITIYPIKSLDGVTVDDVAILPSGGLADDRRYALVDRDGRYVNGKRTAAVHAIRAEFDLPSQTVRLCTNPDAEEVKFSLVEDHKKLAESFSRALGIACNFVENAHGGFPDDIDAPGPTLVSTATLETVASWFPGLSLDETRRRFRANLEIDGVEPFWEDRLVGPHETTVAFMIGNVHWLGVFACQRCVVPTRMSDTGELTPYFQKSFATNRERLLPPWAARQRFDHFYRLAVNTRLAAGQASGRLFVGDAVRID